MKRIILALHGVLLSGAVSAPGQIPISGGTYSQNFNSLATSGTSNPWVDNSTLPGWYASKTAGGAAVTTYRADAGTGNAGALYSYGTGTATERALGSIASVTPGNIAFGVRFTNDTSLTVTNVVISYTGEEWRNGGNNDPNALAFSYRTGNLLTNSDAANANTWTSVPALNFTAPTISTNVSALDGNVASNRVTFTSVALTVSVAPGQEIFLRWFDANDLGTDYGLAVDDLSVAFEGTTNSTPPPVVAGFSLLNYNTHGNFVGDWTTDSPQVQAIGRQVQHLNPDIITFQEIPLTNNGWTNMPGFVAAYRPGFFLTVSPGSDTFICSAIISRWPITRSRSWLDSADLAPFGYASADFTRDLFETQIAVPGFPQPLHVFTVHLKSGQGTDDSNRRTAEAGCISNYFVTGFLTTNSLRPYVLTGDMNEDINDPPSSNPQSIQKLISPPTGLRLTTPVNPFTSTRFTFSIQGSLDSRYDYILPNSLLFSNIASSQVFRTDLLPAPTPPLLGTDSETASDHLPVLMVFNNPYVKPFKLLFVGRTNQTVTLRWESVPGQPYRVECSTNLSTWGPLASNLVATNLTVTYATNLSDNVRFFRIYRGP